MSVASLTAAMSTEEPSTASPASSTRAGGGTTLVGSTCVISSVPSPDIFVGSPSAAVTLVDTSPFAAATVLKALSTSSLEADANMDAGVRVSGVGALAVVSAVEAVAVLASPASPVPVPII